MCYKKRRELIERQMIEVHVSVVLKHPLKLPPRDRVRNKIAHLVLRPLRAICLSDFRVCAYVCELDVVAKAALHTAH